MITPYRPSHLSAISTDSDDLDIYSGLATQYDALVTLAERPFSRSPRSFEEFDQEIEKIQAKIEEYHRLYRAAFKDTGSSCGRHSSRYDSSRAKMDGIDDIFRDILRDFDHKTIKGLALYWAKHEDETIPRDSYGEKWYAALYVCKLTLGDIWR